jgi:uncharacterized membrane protein YhaH (DUF805 family)
MRQGGFAMEWMLMPLKRYAEFSGRSRRKEYWMYFLFLIIVGFVLGLIEGVMGLQQTVAGLYGPLSLLFALATFIPSLAVGVRRLHDTERSGWWVLLPILPYALSIAMFFSGNLPMAGIFGFVALGLAIVLLVFMVLDGTKGPNKYGPDPKGGVDADKVFA